MWLVLEHQYQRLLRLIILCWSQAIARGQDLFDRLQPVTSLTALLSRRPKALRQDTSRPRAMTGLSALLPSPLIFSTRHDAPLSITPYHSLSLPSRPCSCSLILLSPLLSVGCDSQKPLVHMGMSLSLHLAFATQEPSLLSSRDTPTWLLICLLEFDSRVPHNRRLCRAQSQREMPVSTAMAISRACINNSLLANAKQTKHAYY
ncbi:hypothetical protein B0J15DRAFT_120841 [Fusarium solani]|jgi:hypothetical protein|uniref:Uncharacterized protein n=1 Tax=Fusarium solani TaxID=169388 RepID=A0A9P9L551_FUSSL|nr:uncharacterized protein B0J15DRAFT_120841 [Fusarium solani]KAH7274115.1 hypothetical protein B0J15DRAFT_120841 [Fusarium solani]